MISARPIALTRREAAAYRGAMSTIAWRVVISGVCAGLLAVGCSGDDGEGMDVTGGMDGSSTAATGGANPTTGNDDGDDDGGSSGGNDDADASSGFPDPSDGSTGGGSTDEGDADSGGSETGSEVVFDEEFVWVADFLRTNCTACHATNMNGALLLPSPDISNDEVRLALEGVQADTGLLLVEPFDREASQTYLQITNEFGAQFSVEDTDRFGAWIDAGANYFAP